MTDANDIPGIERADDAELQREIENEQERLRLAERRQEAIQNRVRFLMNRGEKYDPATVQNFLEALDSSSDEERKIISSLVLNADKHRFRDESRNRIALQAISNVVFDYWERIARLVATEEIDRQWTIED